MSTDKNNEVSVQRKEDALADKDKISSDTKSELNAKRSASELSGEEGKQKIQKTEHKSEYQVLLYCCFLMLSPVFTSLLSIGLRAYVRKLLKKISYSSTFSKKLGKRYIFVICVM
nr:uncharacterized protein LOC107449508 isoform X2 [Parasteatoda tepidariorum]